MIVLIKHLYLLALFPLGFLIYTIINLKTLDITLTHPRVIVEASVFVIMLAFGITLFIRYR